MDVEAACIILDRLIYKPDWKITAVPYNNIQGALCITIHHPAVDSSKACLREGYPSTFEADRPFVIQVSDCTMEEFQRRILEKILEVETHEAREFFRDASTGDAPFHPHTPEGMRAWGDVERDLHYGR